MDSQTPYAAANGAQSRANSPGMLRNLGQCPGTLVSSRKSRPARFSPPFSAARDHSAYFVNLG
jgi:hypothetical protein